MELTNDERTTLEARALGPDSHGERTRKHILRAKIVLAYAEGLDAESVAARVGLQKNTVEKWRARFVQDRLRGLDDKPRRGAPRRISDTQIEDVLCRTLEPTPSGATPWSLRTLARATGLSRSTIDRIWRTFGVTPPKNTSRASGQP